MKSVLFTLLICLLAPQLSAQEIEKKEFFRDKNQGKSTTEARAKFVKVFIKNPDGSRTEEFRRVKDDLLLRTETYKNDKPFGVWRYYDEDGTLILERDYNFDLNYNFVPADDEVVIDLYTGDPISALPEGFQTTMMTQEVYNKSLVKNLRYPVQATRRGIQGEVFLLVSISKEGKVAFKSVFKSADFYLDLEAARVVNLLPEVAPATVNGQPINLYATCRIKFMLR